MPAKKKIDYKKLLKAVESGKPQSEIIKEFKFNTSTQLKNHYLDALMETGKAPAINTRRSKSQASPSKEVSVRKSGSVIIPKLLIDEMGFSKGDKFAVRKTKAGISLKQFE